MKFVVSYSQEKDRENYLNTLWRFQYLKYGRLDIQDRLLSRFPVEFRAKLTQAATREEAAEVVRSYLQELPPSFKAETEAKARDLEKLLNEQSELIEDDLEKIYQKDFPFETVTVFLTTAGICPYSYEDRWFMVGRECPPEECLQISEHELNHFMFYNCFPDLRDSLGKDDYESLKEGMAILSDPGIGRKPTIEKLERYILSISEKPASEIVQSVLEKRDSLLRDEKENEPAVELKIS
jgi:hypothetical protein